jgi:hypothetical protein
MGFYQSTFGFTFTYNKQLKEKFETFIQVFASTNQIKPI